MPYALPCGFSHGKAHPCRPGSLRRPLWLFPLRYVSVFPGLHLFHELEAAQQRVVEASQRKMDGGGLSCLEKEGQREALSVHGLVQKIVVQIDDAEDAVPFVKGHVQCDGVRRQIVDAQFSLQKNGLIGRGKAEHQRRICFVADELYFITSFGRKGHGGNVVQGESEPFAFGEHPCTGDLVRRQDLSGLHASVRRIFPRRPYGGGSGAGTATRRSSMEFMRLLQKWGEDYPYVRNAGKCRDQDLSERRRPLYASACVPSVRSLRFGLRRGSFFLVADEMRDVFLEADVFQLADEPVDKVFLEL